MESKRLESRKTLRSGADKLAGTMISNFKNTLLSTLNFMKNISQEKIGLGNLTSATDWLHGFPFTLIKSTF